MSDTLSQEELMAIGRAAEAASLDLQDLEALGEFRVQGGDLLRLMKRVRQELDHEAVRSGRRSNADMSLFSPETAAQARAKHHFRGVDDDPLEELMRDYGFKVDELAQLLSVPVADVEAHIQTDGAFGI